ncbi:right-handed parallel beta-helix repeat-containing protein [Pedobacter segetis]|uniref:right-handed parallel beta-helix repeat-containing protein n=1 Tax=Pedobacter segetis TaxID=2793069 RepID=UPI001F2DE5DC|nr:right-handed parallel beta-helix repeat-containing protein [Pedobacter segetis]
MAQVQKLKLKPGDKILLANGEIYVGCFNIINQQGNKLKPIKITSIKWDDDDNAQPAIIDFKGLEQGVLIQGCSFLEVSNLQLTANGYQALDNSQKMRCGVLINNLKQSLMTGICLNQLIIKDVYFENRGYKRGAEEVKSANGTQKYGWGIKVVNESKSLLKNLTINNCTISDVSHTGIKLTGKAQNIRNVSIENNRVKNTGGPGIQMSGVREVYVANNLVDHSGSTSDSRKWGRGSGLWTWGSSNILIEKNQFLNANGPGDSAGAHIDFNCDNVVIQYNFSRNNAGGFCEILGNNYNCAYRYNVSVNDGYRIKGKNGAFQEGKTLWLSGFQGTKATRKGPVNTYIYNNTVYCDSTIVPKIAFDNTSSGILIANNIFYTECNFKAVLGDQYKPDTENSLITENVIFSNNLFASRSSWPTEASIKDTNPFYGNPVFSGIEKKYINAFTPKNIKEIQHQGIDIIAFPFNRTKLNYPLKMDKDILGNKLIGKPNLGAIQPF